jgi:hypothetical protein
MTRATSDYTALITPAFQKSTNFVQTVAATVAPLADLQTMISGLPQDFDLDYAVGPQLDVVGQWVGISRAIPIPVLSPWFALDDSAHGLDVAPWFQAGISAGVTMVGLDDDDYRRLLRAKIQANSWDGTATSAQAILQSFFASTGTYVFCEDRGNLEMIFAISGTLPPIVDLQIFWQKLIPIKPPAVSLTTAITSVNGSPLFGFDVTNNYIKGLDFGAWGLVPQVSDVGTSEADTLDEANFWKHLLPVFGFDVSDPLIKGFDQGYLSA